MITTKKTTNRRHQATGTWAVFVKHTRGSGTSLFGTEAAAMAAAEALQADPSTRYVTVLHP